MKIHVRFESGLEAYQVSENGIVTHYEDMEGNFLFNDPPPGGCEVVQ